MWFQKPPLGTPLDWGNPLNDGTMLALAMNEGHGDKLRDLSLNGNHGTLNNFAFPPTVASGWNPGQTGVGLNFDGINDAVYCGNNASINVVDALTISVWVYSTGYNNAASFDVVATRGNYLDTNPYGIWRETGTSGKFAFSVSDGTIKRIGMGEGFGWLNLVGTYDRGDMKTYMNGVYQSSDTTGIQLTTTATELKIGGGEASRYFNGPIDQPRIQSRAWSAKEVMDYAINPWQVYLDE